MVAQLKKNFGEEIRKKRGHSWADPNNIN